ncbi:MAG: cryptochrome/photolyase family protein [Opitutales bacterium]|nr:cryptochrome/photolyase family protein [Opitutales bacterium]
MGNSTHPRNLFIVLGDQLDANSLLFRKCDPKRDQIWMAEADEESTHVWSHQQRIVLFLSAMRHFRDALKEKGYAVSYHELSPTGKAWTLSELLARDLEKLSPGKVFMVEPGEYRVQAVIEKTVRKASRELTILPDQHFYASREEFADHARNRKSLRMEFFYREMRRKHNVLMEGDKPVGGTWNYDHDNRESFGKKGPDLRAREYRPQLDDTTKEVMVLVKRKFSQHPGSLESFPWPVTREQALRRLKDFLENRLPFFGKYQDAMWTGEPFLYHSLISSSLNLKLLSPREVVEGAAKAYREGHAPLAAVEGFIRQILGWREYVRGIYWLHMPDYVEKNHLGAKEDLPEFYWTGDTRMQCVREAVGSTLEHGYAHHIHRLMVTGLFALMYGVHPRQVHEWYLAVYVDAVEWVELPNTLGMSQFGDGGLMASKPYVATGKYIRRMSNYCQHCPYNPDEAVGEKACPFTTLYWDFLLRHETLLRKNQRMSLQVRNIDRLSDERRKELQAQAKSVREKARNGKL